MSSDVQYYKRLKEAELSSSTDGNLANTCGSIIAQVQTRVQTTPLTAQAFANSNIAETMFQVVKFPGRFMSGNITMNANVAANTTSYAVLTVKKRTAGATAVTVATANLANVATTAWIPVPLTVANAANAQVAAGDTLSYTIDSGTGTPAGATVVTGAILDVAYEDV